jgi:hypothetical protein
LKRSFNTITASVIVSMGVVMAKVMNGVELASPGDAPDSITYMAALSEDGNTLELDIEITGGGHWSFKLVKD